MYSIGDLQLAVMQENVDNVEDILSEIDRKTETLMFLEASKYFGFKVSFVQGRTYAIKGEVASVMGYVNESGLRKTLQKYGLETRSIGSFVQPGRNKLIQDFGLSPKAGRTELVTWPEFLVAGMSGTSDQSRKVKIYLLKMERAARVAGGTLDAAKAHELALARAKDFTLIVSRIDSMRDKKLRLLAYEHADALLSGALSTGQQGNLFTEGT